MCTMVFSDDISVFASYLTLQVSRLPEHAPSLFYSLLVPKRLIVACIGRYILRKSENLRYILEGNTFFRINLFKSSCSTTHLHLSVGLQTNYVTSCQIMLVTCTRTIGSN